jgi:hypothetical protein
MKKILIIMIFILGLTACENQENIFPDFEYTAVYFPYQYPVRTLVLGDYIYDNTNDNNHRFLISAGFGGVYSNKKDRVLDIKVDESLCKNALFESSSDTIHLMPSTYYTLSSTDKLVIPAGKFNGSITVQLTDAFFDDPKAIKLNYVIPIRITNCLDVDSILNGKTSKTNPDPRIADLWDIAPQNFTMFAVKFINPYHATYLHRGKSIVKDATNNTLETNVYRTTHITDNELWTLKTSGKNQVSVNGTLQSNSINGDLKLLLEFNNNGDCTSNEDQGSTDTVTGSGSFVSEGVRWG